MTAVRAAAREIMPGFRISWLSVRYERMLLVKRNTLRSRQRHPHGSLPPPLGVVEGKFRAPVTNGMDSARTELRR